MTGFGVQGHNDNVCSVYQNAFPSFTSQNTCSDRRTRFNPPPPEQGCVDHVPLCSASICKRHFLSRFLLSISTVLQICFAMCVGMWWL